MTADHPIKSEHPAEFWGLCFRRTSTRGPTVAIYTGVGSMRRVVQGWLNYHAVPGNSVSLGCFVDEVKKLWLHTLRRRSQKGRDRWPWFRFARLAAHICRVPEFYTHIRGSDFTPDSRQEPYEVILHVRICAGAVGNGGLKIVDF